jgi:hypothetical protein
MRVTGKYIAIILMLFAINIWGQSGSIIEQINAKLSSVRYLPVDSDRLQVGTMVVKQMTEWLQSDTSFSGRNWLKHVGKVSSPDKQFNIYTFNIPLIDGTHVFWGVIQMRPRDGKCRVFVLNDVSRQYTARPVFEQFTADRWYGSLYYEIIVQKVKGKKIYTLLGSCLNNSLFTNKKIIETLWFDENGLPIFGYPLFEYGLKVQSRVIFEYTIMAQMSIHYNKRLEMIIFDHLAPSSPLYVNNYKFYGPDASFDGFYFKDDLWRFFPNINPYARR